MRNKDTLVTFGDNLREHNETYKQDLTSDDIVLLVKDLRAMEKKEDWGAPSRCYQEWLRRIGGGNNLKSYAETRRAVELREYSRKHRDIV